VQTFAALVSLINAPRNRGGRSRCLTPVAVPNQGKMATQPHEAELRNVPLLWSQELASLRMGTVAGTARKALLGNTLTFIHITCNMSSPRAEDVPLTHIQVELDLCDILDKPH
jgi:hypothetical protein